MSKVLVKFEIPGGTAKQYNEAWEQLRAAGYSNPKGLIHHTGAPNGNTWLVVDVWESAEAFQKFVEVLGPIIQKVGFKDVEPVILPVEYDLVSPTATSSR